ncbi:hypothetical protein PHYPSEUDO_008083 [Phytophthora pseudosyringae]|uniref:Uncharacterized protein n=1 Tax=Phytophthora pseudosyringae TaxID=221518 RepID=A0A8T1VFX0_9STRA|nr:hypothetical protein PHYPSEUDO_008083 [Phytophthora pseudosyringae]
MAERGKYKHAQEVFSRISSKLTDFPDAKFEAAMDNLETWWNNLRQGNLSLPVQPSQSGSASEIASTQLAATTEGDEVQKDEQVHDGISGGKRDGVDRALSHSIRELPKRKEYNVGSKLCKFLREKDVVEIKRYLDTNRPPVREVFSFLNTLEIRFRGYSKKKMTVTLVTSEPDPTPMSFRLPEAMVTAALLAVTQREAEMDDAEKEVDLCSPDKGTSHGEVKTRWCTVNVEGAGDFSKNRLQAMKYLWNMAKTGSLGMKCYSWLMSEADVHFSAEGAEAVAREMINAWPEDNVPV